MSDPVKNLSGFLDEMRDMFAAAPPAGLRLDGDICRLFAEGFAEAFEMAASLEAVARSVDLLGEREFRAAVTSLPLDDRRALARAALRRAEGRVVPLRGAFAAGRAFGDGRDAEGGA